MSDMRSSNMRQRMAEEHEQDLACWFEGRIARSSGNQFNDQGDGRQDRRERLMAWAWDCKSTMNASIVIQRRAWNKIVEQSHGERPMLPLRFYDDERLTVGLDLVVVSTHDLAELMIHIEKISRIRELYETVADGTQDIETYEKFVRQLGRLLEG